MVVAAKRGLYEFREAHGPVRMPLGISRGEEQRVADPDDPNTPRYMCANVQRAYPLLDLGLDRGACQAYIAACGLPVPWPSNCMRCCWADEVELLWLARRYPTQYAEWVQLEAEKLAADPTRLRRKPARLPVQAALDGQAAEARPRWLGVFGERLLPEVLAAAEARYGDRTLAELDAYRMQHGHCIQTAY